MEGGWVKAQAKAAVILDFCQLDFVRPERRSNIRLSARLCAPE
jgi:hypothetical protein